MQRIEQIDKTHSPSRYELTAGGAALGLPPVLDRVRTLAGRPFIRNVFAVASGTAAAQAITMAFAPAIARLYGPHAFGLLGTFTAVLGVLAPVAALTYPIAIVLPKADADARGLARLSLYIATAMASALALVLLLAGDRLTALLHIEPISAYLMLLPLAMLLSACMQVAEQWRIRKKQFAITARVAVLQSLVMNASKAGIGLFEPVAAVLIVLTTFGNGLYAAMLNWATRHTVPEARPEPGPEPRLGELARRHRDFPLYRAPQVCLNAASQSLPVLMLASFFGPSAAGFYTLGRTVMAMPIRLVGKSVGDVFYPRFTEAAHKGQNLGALILKATGLLAATGFVPFALVAVLGPWLFRLVFGQQWVVAGEYAQWLAVWLYFGFLNRPSVAAIATLSMQRFFLAFEGVSIALRVAAILVGFFVFHSDLAAVAAFSLAGAAINFLLIVATVVACGRRARPAAAQGGPGDRQGSRP